VLKAVNTETFVTPHYYYYYYYYYCSYEHQHRSCQCDSIGKYAWAKF